MKLLKDMSKRTILIIAVLGIGLTAALIGMYLLVHAKNEADNAFEIEHIYSFDLGTIDLSDISSDLEDEQVTLENIYEQIDASREEPIETGSSTGNSTDSTTQNPYAYPDIILPCTRNGNDLLVLVNKQYQLPTAYAPGDLVGIEGANIRVTKSGMLIRNIIVSDLSAVVTAAGTKNIDLAVLSAYRSYDSQQNTYNYWVSYNGGDTSAADMISARPGHSQHQLGTAIDFTTNEISDQLGQHFGNTTAGQWLAQHAWKYGFAIAYPSGWESTTGYSYEPWHFRYIGKENASEWHGSGEILEVWLQGKD